MRGRVDEPAVVTLPAEIEQDSAGLALGDVDSMLDGAAPAYAALREAVVSGAPVVVADLTGTTFCDYPGFRQLVAIHREIVALARRTGAPQDLGTGKEYRGYMRTLVPELRARWALRRGLLSFDQVSSGNSGRTTGDRAADAA